MSGDDRCWEGWGDRKRRTVTREGTTAACMPAGNPLTPTEEEGQAEANRLASIDSCEDNKTGKAKRSK